MRARHPSKLNVKEAKRQATAARKSARAAGVLGRGNVPGQKGKVELYPAAAALFAEGESHIKEERWEQAAEAFAAAEATRTGQALAEPEPEPEPELEQLLTLEPLEQEQGQGQQDEQDLSGAEEDGAAAPAEPPPLTDEQWAYVALDWARDPLLLTIGASWLTSDLVRERCPARCAALHRVVLPSGSHARHSLPFLADLVPREDEFVSPS